jgi:hypothetical protein
LATEADNDQAAQVERRENPRLHGLGDDQFAVLQKIDINFKSFKALIFIIYTQLLFIYILF